MKVRELIEYLSVANPELPVRFLYDTLLDINQVLFVLANHEYDTHVLLAEEDYSIIGASYQVPADKVMFSVINVPKDGKAVGE